MLAGHRRKYTSKGFVVSQLSFEDGSFLSLMAEEQDLYAVLRIHFVSNAQGRIQCSQRQSHHLRES